MLLIYEVIEDQYLVILHDIGTYYNMKNGWVTYDKYSIFLINDSFTQEKTRIFEFYNIEIYQVILN